MRIAVLGNGPAGTTLYRLLRSKLGAQVDLFGKKENTVCGLKSCAWGVNKPKFRGICEELGLSYEKYCTNHCNSFRLSGFKFACDMVMIDKPLLVSDLAGDDILYSQPQLKSYDRIIDATGFNGGPTHATYQALVKAKLPLSLHIGVYPSLHCFWSFPLYAHTAHVGVLSFTGRLGGLEKKLKRYTPICECYSHIHSGGLTYPIVEGNVWKVGERAGAVDPITGSGILTSMVSAILLFKNWDDPKGYEKAMRRKFGYTTNKVRTLFHNEFRGPPITLKLRI